MLNYIWGGLIVFSLLFALISDLRDFSGNTYANGQALPVTVALPEGYDPDARTQRATVDISGEDFNAHFQLQGSTSLSYEAELIQTQKGRRLHFASGASVPEPLATICQAHSRDNDCRGTLLGNPSAAVFAATVSFDPVVWVKMNAIASAALDFAETAVTIALGLIGGLALWMGLLKIAEASGLVFSLVRVTQPLLRRLFPEVPKDHPALGMIALNLTANMLGLGNAATPLGIKAMQELQTLNPTTDTATNPMVMLLAMNTASVQIVPPVLLVAIMGLHVNQLFFSILITTALSLAVAIIATKLLGRLKAYRRTNPEVN